MSPHEPKVMKQDMYAEQIFNFQEDIVLSEDKKKDYDQIINLYENTNKKSWVEAYIYIVDGKEYVTFVSKKIRANGVNIYDYKYVYHINLLARKDLLVYLVFSALRSHSGMGEMQPKYFNPDYKADVATWNKVLGYIQSLLN